MLLWRGEPLMSADEIRIRGPHNRENAMAAAAVCLARGIEAQAVGEGLSTFAGVPHRLEEIAHGRRRPVRQRLEGDERRVGRGRDRLVREGGVHLIAGGRGKGSDYSPLAAPVRQRCAAVYLIGETAAALRDALAPTGVPVHDCQDLERAFTAAQSAARPGDVVLLSPGCASYDQYRSYEQRGDHFRGLVAALR